MSGRPLTTEEAAVRVFVSAHTIQSWVKRGHLIPVRPGGAGEPALYGEDAVLEAERKTRRPQRMRLLLAASAETLHYHSGQVPVCPELDAPPSGTALAG